MIFYQNQICQHGVQYDQNTLFCLNLDCKYERRLILKQCWDCKHHSHSEDEVDQTFMKIGDQSRLSTFLHKKLCDLEFYIMNPQADLGYLLEQVKYATSLIKKFLYLGMLQECLIFKRLQIIQQQTQDSIGQALTEFKLLITQTDTQQMNMIQQAEKYQITITLFGLDLSSFLAISPNEKYLLIGTLNYMYIYDIKTDLNKKIYQLTQETNIAQFSQNSTKIIFANPKRISIFDIETNKTQIQILKILEIQKRCMQLKARYTQFRLKQYNWVVILKQSKR